MTILRLIRDEILGLFVDDGAMALQVIILIAVLGGAVKLAGLPPLVAGLLLIVGLLAILAASLWRKTRG